MNSDMSKLMRASSLPNRNSASDFASSVLPTPDGPRKMNEPPGRRGSLSGERLRRMARATLLTASSWPMTRWCRASSQRRSFEASASVRLDTGTPVMSETTSAMSFSSTTTTFLLWRSCQDFSSSSRLDVSSRSLSRRRAASSNSWAVAAFDFCSLMRASSSSTCASSGGSVVLWTRVRAPASSMMSMALSGRNLSCT